MIGKEAPSADLVAITYPDEHRAAAVVATLRWLQQEYLLDLEDSCVVTKDAQGKIKLHQAVNLTAAGVASGAFCGSLIGMLFFFPLGSLAVAGGLAVGAASGTLASDVGRQFERKWLTRTEAIDAGALEVPDFSATTDLYQKSMTVKHPSSCRSEPDWPWAGIWI
jgi:Protein of unknown function (DUF1269)